MIRTHLDNAVHPSQHLVQRAGVAAVQRPHSRVRRDTLGPCSPTNPREYTTSLLLLLLLLLLLRQPPPPPLLLPQLIVSISMVFTVMGPIK